MNMAEYRVSSNSTVLMCAGLGSCVGLVLYDPFSKIGGLAHIMLPSSARKNHDTRQNKTKFADTAIGFLLGKMVEEGADQRHIAAKIFGGANMFTNVGSKTLTKVGDRNVLAVQEELKKRKVKLIASEVGGNIGRTIIFDMTNGKVTVKTISGEERIY